MCTGKGGSEQQARPPAPLGCAARVASEALEGAALSRGRSAGQAGTEQEPLAQGKAPGGGARRALHEWEALLK